MSTYTVTPTGYTGATSWSSYAGTIAGGNLADASDWTGVRSVSAYAFVIEMGTKTIPANEVVSSLLMTARGRRFSGTGSCLVSATVDDSPVRSLALSTSTATFVDTSASVSLLMTQAQVDGLQVLLKAPASGVYDLSELSVALTTSSLPQAPTIASPSGTVDDSTRPSVAWTHVDRTEAALSTGARSGTTVTIATGAAHGFLAGQVVRISSSDARFDGVWTIASVPTSTSFTFTHTDSGTIGTLAITGTAWIGEDKGQQDAQVAIFTSAQYGASGFDPETSAAAWRASSYYAQTASSFYATPDVDLPNASNYRAYVRTAVTIAGQKVWSEWSYSTFTLAVTPQAAPDFTAIWDEVDNLTHLSVQGHSNLLTENQANGTEDGTTIGSWTNGTNVFVTSSTTVAKSGTRSVRLASAAAGTMDGYTSEVAEVIEGQAYSARCSVRAGASARSVSLGIRWLDSGGSTVSTSTGSAANDSTSVWTDYTASGTAPATAVAARLVVTVASTGAASEYHYVDEAILAPGTISGWTPGGQGGLEALIERSIDGGDTWTTVRTPPDQTAGTVGIVLDATQSLTIADHEAPRGVTVDYRASIVSDTLQASTAAEDVVESTSDGLCWVKVLDHPDLNLGYARIMVDGYGETQDTQAEVYRGASDGDAFVIHHLVNGWDRDITVEAWTADEVEALKAVVAARGTVLVQFFGLYDFEEPAQLYGEITGQVRIRPTQDPRRPRRLTWEVEFTVTETA